MGWESKFICSRCGQTGGTYCDMVDTTGQPAGNRWHVTCYCIQEGYDNRDKVTARSSRGGQTPAVQALHRMRNQNGRGQQHSRETLLQPLQLKVPRARV